MATYKDLAVLAIAQQSREIDHTGDYVLSIDQIAKLIEDFGKQEYNRGIAKGTEYPWQEDMGH
jgi:hypothetical protein